MSILSIDTIYKNEDGDVYVSAVVEDAVQTHAQTFYDPAEYGPALCQANFYLDEDQILPEDDSALIKFIEDLDLDWELVDNSDYYMD
jgi:hypothetical protein